MHINNPLDPTHARFQQWLVAGGASVKGVSVRETGGDANKGLFYEPPSDTNAGIATVPSRLVLSVTNLLYLYSDCFPPFVNALQEFAKRHPGTLSDRLIFLCHLLCWRIATASNSTVHMPFGEYTAVLPKTLITPMFYTEEELRLLNGTSLASAVLAKMVKLYAEFEMLHNVFLHFQQTMSDAHRQDLAINFEDYKWADAVYWSRVLELPHHPHPNILLSSLSTRMQRIASMSTRCMIPLLDFSNHSFTPNICWAQTVCHDSSSDIVIDLVESIALDYMPGLGDQLFISYGEDKPNHELLFIHGFVTTNNNNRVARVNVMTELQELLYRDDGSTSPQGELIRMLRLAPLITINEATTHMPISIRDCSLVEQLKYWLSYESVALIAIVALPDDVIVVDSASNIISLCNTHYNMLNDAEAILLAIFAHAAQHETHSNRMREFIETIIEHQLDALTHTSAWYIDMTAPKGKEGTCVVKFPATEDISNRCTVAETFTVRTNVAHYASIFRDEQKSILESFLYTYRQQFNGKQAELKLSK